MGQADSLPKSPANPRHPLGGFEESIFGPTPVQLSLRARLGIRMLEETLFTNVGAAVMTSATLSVGGDFAYVRDRTGIEGAEERIVPSPFDYRTQAVLYLPKHEIGCMDECAAKVLDGQRPLWGWLFRRIDFKRWFGPSFQPPVLKDAPPAA